MSLSFRYDTPSTMVKVTETSPSGVVVVSDYALEIMNNKGEYIGEAGLDIWDSEHLVESNEKFTETGVYTCVIEQNTPVDPLPYSMGIGIIIEKSKIMKKLFYAYLIFVSISPVKANDSCSSIDLDVNGNCGFDMFKTEESDDPQDGDCIDGTNPNELGLWMKLTVPGSGHVEINTEDDEFPQGCISVFSGPHCNNLTEIYCDNSGNGMPSVSLLGRTPGETLWIFFWEEDGEDDLGFLICTLEGTILLPVDLVHFSANVLSHRNVKLEWETFSEINNDFFTVQRSTNGMEWEDITFVNGTGHSSQTVNYESFDKLAYYGLSYYRLKQTDFDGQVSFSMIRSVYVKKQSQITMSIYPNPASNLVYIKGIKIDISSIAIYNSFGQNVTSLIQFERVSDLEIKLYLETLPNGIYFLRTLGLVEHIIKN